MKDGCETPAPHESYKSFISIYLKLIRFQHSPLKMSLKGEGHDFAHAVCHSIFITQGLSWRIWGAAQYNRIDHNEVLKWQRRAIRNTKVRNDTKGNRFDHNYLHDLKGPWGNS